MNSVTEDETDAHWVQNEEARHTVVDATTAIASLVRSTLGPHGSEKLVQTVDPQDEPEIIVSSSGQRILDAIERGGGFNHPVAALVVDALDSMDRALSDGTTTTAVLVSGLVEQGSDLVERGLHPTNVILGYALAATKAGEVLDEMAREVSISDEDLLAAVARTSMTGEFDSTALDRIANDVARVVASMAREDRVEIDTDDVKVVADPHATNGRHRGVLIRRGPGPLKEYMTDSVRFDPSPSDDMIRDATVAIIDKEIDPETTATTLGQGRETGVQVSSFDAAKQYLDDVVEWRRATAERLRKLGVDLLVSEPEMERELRYAFEDMGIRVLDNVCRPKSDIRRVARATHANIVSDIEDLTSEDVGTAGRVVERAVDEQVWTRLEHCPGSVYSITANADSSTHGERLEKNIVDAVDVTARAVMDGQILPGGGAPAMAVATALRSYAPGISGIEQYAVSSFADACEDVVRALAENSGHDPIDATVRLRRAHNRADGPSDMGLSQYDGSPVDAWTTDVVEPRRVFSQALETARETAEPLVTMDTLFYPTTVGEIPVETAHD